MFFNITEETHGFESSHNIKPQHPVFSFLGVVITNMPTPVLSSLLSYTGTGLCIYCATYDNVPVNRGVTCS